MIEDAGELIEFDTLELTRRGRQEQARAIAGFLSEAISKLRQIVGTITAGVSGSARPQMNEGLKGN